MEEELSFPLQRSPAMNLLGKLWTGALSGMILVAVLLLIGVGFMATQNFSALSIIFFLAFLMPAAILLHNRLVRRGSELMEEWCDIKYYSESDTLQFKSGFPNTMNPEWQDMEITDDNRDIFIKGGEVGGYHLRLGNPPNPNDAVRLGLWIELEDAQEAADQLAKFLKGSVTTDIKTDSEEGTNV